MYFTPGILKSQTDVMLLMLSLSLSLSLYFIVQK